MPGPRKINKGQRLAGIPGDGWNGFVDTHYKVAQWRQKTNGPGQATADDRSVVVLLQNDSGSDVPQGGVLKLGEPIVLPATRAEITLEGLMFLGETPAVNEPHVAITSVPIADGEIGSGFIPGAAWAKVNVSNAGHTFAAPKASVDELESSDSNGFQIIWKESGTGAGKWAVIKLFRDVVINVYEFRNCTAPALTLFLDNPTIAEHDPGEVAVIVRDGVYDCWQLIGPAPFCKTGECAIVMAWGADCDACNVCFYLTLCGGGSPTFVRGIEWWEYEGGVVLLNGPGHEGCYSVAVADGCFDVNEALNVSHVVTAYANCNQCGCYQLENCADDTDTLWVDNDLATIVGQATGAASVGSFVRRQGVCWTIVAFASPCGVTPVHWEDEEIERIESCSGCCWLLTPCPGQVGDPPVKYYRLQSGDPDLNEFVDDEGVSNGRVLRLADDICYAVSIPETCPETGVILGLPTVKEEYDSCEDCAITCWERCDAPGTFIRTYSDMSDVGPNAAVKRAEDGKCYTRETSPGTCGTPTIVVFTIQEIIDESVDSCTICQTPRVKLTPSCGSGCSDCSGSSGGGSGSGGTAIVTDNAAFFEHVGKYIKMEGDCRLVEWTTNSLVGAVGCWTGPYTSCAACAEAPTQLTLVAQQDGEIVGLKVQGAFQVCGTVDVTDDCPAAPAAAPNAYAFASLY